MARLEFALLPREKKKALTIVQHREPSGTSRSLARPSMSSELPQMAVKLPADTGRKSARAWSERAYMTDATLSNQLLTLL